MSADGVAALSRVVLDERPWVRMDGLPIFADATAVRSWTRPLLPVLFDASGAVVGGSVHAGSTSPDLPGDATSTCMGWSDPLPGTYVPIGLSARVGRAWFADPFGLCSSTHRFYCLED
ncbi:MAG: hypothetical protein K1X94_21600 [Sandaracinaceae bacterium]|nr:hypothetical protein [Sandaracinaceae bacterium]